MNNEWDIVSVLCHEIAHQWFGDLVTADTWGDLLLHESFATFFMTYLPLQFKKGMGLYAVRNSKMTND